MYDAQKVPHSAHESRVQRELQQSEDGYRNKGHGIDKGRSPSLLHVNYEDHSGRESQHRRRHCKEEESECQRQLSRQRLAEILEPERRGEDGDEHHHRSERADQ